MKTLKIPYTGNINILSDLRRQYSSAVRYSYNRVCEGKILNETYFLLQKLNNLELLNSWFLTCATNQAQQIFKVGGSKVIFGGKKNFELRSQGKISKEEYQKARLLPLYSIGEANAFGNRFFRLNLKDNQIIFSPKYKENYYLTLPKLNKNWQKELEKLEILQNDKEMPITYMIDENFIYISHGYLDSIEIPNLKDNRVLGIDLNPNNIGVSVLEFEDKENYKILETLNFDISKLTIKSKKSSSDSKSKYLHNKLKFETIQITNKIINRCKKWKVKNIIIEDLEIVSKDHTFGRNFNRLVNQKWLRNLFADQLEKRCKIYGLTFKKVYSSYSSYIGNLQHDFTDPINSSIEIARRGYEVLILRNKEKFYPVFKIKESLINLWNEKVKFETILDWKPLFGEIKNLKLKYRVSLEECSHTFEVFRLSNSKSSNVNLYNFCIN